MSVEKLNDQFQNIRNVMLTMTDAKKQDRQGLSDTRSTTELAGPGNVYVYLHINKRYKVDPHGCQPLLNLLMPEGLGFASWFAINLTLNCSQS